MRPRPPSPGCAAIERATGPPALVLTRQALPQLPRNAGAGRGHPPRRLRAGRLRGRAGVHRDRHRLGGRHRRRGGATRCNGSGRRVRLVSMPCTETFDAQDDGLPGERAAAGGDARAWRWRPAPPPCWWRYVGLRRPGDRHRSLRRLGQGAGRVHSISASPPITSSPSRSTRILELNDGRKRRHGNQGRYQRLRPYRPQRAARAVRGEAHGRDPDRRASTTWATPRPTRT